jgi:hypothetical protein
MKLLSRILDIVMNFVISLFVLVFLSVFFTNCIRFIIWSCDVYNPIQNIYVFRFFLVLCFVGAIVWHIFRPSNILK